MTAPSRVMRSPSQGGTRPPCSGRSALPALRANADCLHEIGHAAAAARTNREHEGGGVNAASSSCASITPFRVDEVAQRRAAEIAPEIVGEQRDATLHIDGVIVDAAMGR